MPGQEKQFQWITRKGRIDIGQIIFKNTLSISHGRVTLFCVIWIHCDRVQINDCTSRLSGQAIFFVGTVNYSSAMVLS